MDILRSGMKVWVKGRILTPDSLEKTQYRRSGADFGVDPEIGAQGPFLGFRALGAAVGGLWVPIFEKFGARSIFGKFRVFWVISGIF